MRRLTRGKTWLLKVAYNITILQTEYYNLTSQAPLMQSPTTQLQSHQQPKSTCSQLKNAFVGFQQTPKRQGQQTMGRLLPACSAFTNPRAQSPTANSLTTISLEGTATMPSSIPPPNGWESTLAALTPRHPIARRIPANSETTRTTNDGAFASSLLSVHEPPELL